MITNIVGALAEAWEEVKVQKARVIMSLIGVVAAVTAMTTVVALGELLMQAERERSEAWEGRHVTVKIESYRAEGDAGEFAPMNDMEPEPIIDGVERDRGLDEALADPVGDAYKHAMERFDVPYWARSKWLNPSVKELTEAYTHGTVHGRPVEWPWEYFTPPEIMPVDPMYATIYRLQVLSGRWLTPSDANQAAIPAVVNETMWKMLGEPDPQLPFIFESEGTVTATHRLVGVVKQVDPWAAPRAYIPYDAWKWATPTADSAGPVTLDVWIGEQDPMTMREGLTSVVRASLGEGYTVDVYGGEQYDSFEDSQRLVRLVIMGIGGIVIALGALGLLNVAIVTVRQRIREIGIRRAVGASARRVFFAVFMESVVATFVAGVIGVMASVLIIRFMPWESMNIFLQDNPAFPTSAALAGIGISTAVGALCGIIPAMMALKVKPIDAIRY